MALDRDRVTSRMGEARLLLQSGQVELAYAQLQELVEAAPENVEANYLMALAARRMGEIEEALDFLQLALHYGPDHAGAWLELAGVHEAAGELRAAADALVRASELQPALASVHRRLGLVLLRLKDPSAAEAALRRAVALAPGDAYAASDLAYLRLREHHDIEGARQLLHGALRSDAKCANAHANLGLVEQSAGRWEVALEHYERALRIDPEAHEARLNRGLLHLMHGDFRRGWQDYDARRRIGAVVPGMHLDLPEWAGESLEGRVLLVYGEQGIGDELMFASCLPDVCAAADRIILCCSPRLEALFRRSFPAVHVVGADQLASLQCVAGAPWRPDLKVAVGSLPSRFRSCEEDFPDRAAYLRADPARVSRWIDRLSQLGPGLKVGLSWRGGTASTRRHLRSVALDELGPSLALPGVVLVNLQYGSCEEEIAQLRARHGITVAHFPELERDFEELAAAVAALDLVISVCTAVIHLCGALGKRAWVLVPAVPEWRYMSAGTRMPWYRSVLLLRQSKPGTWAPVIEEVRTQLEQLLLRSCC